MKWKYLLIILGILFSLIIISAEARGPACNTTQDCYNIYKNSAYTCEFIGEENGYFCMMTKDCGGWTFSRCEGNYGVWENSCNDIRKEPDYRCATCETDKDCFEIFNTTFISCIKNKCEPYGVAEVEKSSNYLMYTIVGILIVLIFIIVFLLRKLRKK
jgi:hypothetical protein